jgi:uncharacterized protein (TIGR03083 family)
MAGVTTQVDDFLAQTSVLADWLDELGENDFAQPSALDGWNLRTLLGHVVLMQVGLGRRLAQPTDEPAAPLGEYVTRYRPAVNEIAESTRDTVGDYTAAELLTQLRDGEPVRTAAAGVDGKTVVAGGRGPVTAGDWVRTRMVEVAVHCDDFSRSTPEREPVPLRRDVLAMAVRTTAEALAEQAPGRSVEIRIPPFIAVQAIEGPTHRRGTPPNVVEMQPLTWLRIACGRMSFTAAVADGSIRASGPRSDISAYLPVLS